MLLTFIVLILENTKFILNFQVQSVGHYFQWGLFQLNFMTDAFGQLREGEGRAVDGNAGDVGWMDGWTVFYVSLEQWPVLIRLGYVMADFSHVYDSVGAVELVDVLGVLCWSLCGPHLTWSHRRRAYCLLACCTIPLLLVLVLHLGRHWASPVTTGSGTSGARKTVLQ